MIFSISSCSTRQDEKLASVVSCLVLLLFKMFEMFEMFKMFVMFEMFEMVEMFTASEVKFIFANWKTKQNKT